MTRGDFRVELRAPLISFYEGILKVPGADGRPTAQIIKPRFTGKPAVAPPPAAPEPEPEPEPAPAPAPAPAGGSGVPFRGASPEPSAAAAAEAARVTQGGNKARESTALRGGTK
jgi:hypothetical protein